MDEVRRPVGEREALAALAAEFAAWAAVPEVAAARPVPVPTPRHPPRDLVRPGFLAAERGGGPEAGARPAAPGAALPAALRAHRRQLAALVTARHQVARARARHANAPDRAQLRALDELAAQLRALEDRAHRRRPPRLTAAEQRYVSDVRRAFTNRDGGGAQE